MKLKLFGKEIFSFENKSALGEMMIGNSRNQLSKSKYIPDFHVGTRMFDNDPTQLFAVSAETAVEMGKEAEKTLKKQKKGDEKLLITPKGVYEMQWLNEKNFKINTNPEYIDKQLQSFKERLNLLKTSEFDMGNGSLEIQSMVIRLENRKKYPDFHEYYSQFAYTKTSKIEPVLKANPHLRMGLVDQFVADMPEEAVKIMKEYRAKTEKLCGKWPYYYIIADKKDFKKTEKRRDPILLAQSPFGHFWQILGAWDKEMLLLSDL